MAKHMHNWQLAEYKDGILKTHFDPSRISGAIAVHTAYALWLCHCGSSSRVEVKPDAK